MKSASSENVADPLLNRFVVSSSDEPIDLDDVSPQTDFVESLRKRLKERKPTVDTSNIPASSACVERSFSAARLVLRPGRMRLEAERLEEVVFLKLNQHLW